MILCFWISDVEGNCQVCSTTILVFKKSSFNLANLQKICLWSGIFTNISTFTPWLLDTMAKDSIKENVSQIPSSAMEPTDSGISNADGEIGSFNLDVNNTKSLFVSSTSTKAPKYICCFWQINIVAAMNIESILYFSAADYLRLQPFSLINKFIFRENTPISQIVV